MYYLFEKNWEKQYRKYRSEVNFRSKLLWTNNRMRSELKSCKILSYMLYSSYVKLYYFTNTHTALWLALQEMSAVKEFIEKQLPRVWPQSNSLWPLDTDLSPQTCHSLTGNSHDPLQHMSMNIQLYILWTCNTCKPSHLTPFFVISYIIIIIISDNS